MSEFIMSVQDYGFIADISCTDSNCSPNQADLREALNKLFHALHSLEHVDITIKTVSET